MEQKHAQSSMSSLFNTCYYPYVLLDFVLDGGVEHLTTGGHHKASFQKSDTGWRKVLCCWFHRKQKLIAPVQMGVQTAPNLDTSGPRSGAVCGSSLWEWWRMWWGRDTALTPLARTQIKSGNMHSTKYYKPKSKNNYCYVIITQRLICFDNQSCVLREHQFAIVANHFA